MTAATPMSAGLIVTILAIALGIQAVTTDLYLPALPALTEGFAAPIGHAQLTLSTLLLAFGVSHLIWGPLSDRFGRRPILLLDGSVSQMTSGIWFWSVVLAITAWTAVRKYGDPTPMAVKAPLALG